MKRPRRRRHGRRVVLAVTSKQSLRLLTGFPEHLAGAGWEVHVVCAEAPRDSQSVTYHQLPMVREPSPSRDLVGLFRWAWLLWRLNPDLIVAGTPKAGLLGTVAAFLVRVPARVYMLRGLRLETETGLKRRLLVAMERMTAATATRVVAVSNSLALEFVAERLAPCDKIVVIGSGSSNGVDLDPVQAKTHVDSQGRCGPPVVGFVGRLHRDKGIPILLGAATRLLDAGIDLNLLLVGPEEPPGYLVECLDQHDLASSKVHWTGAVQDPEAYYSRMDVLCLPTMREGFPNVVLEAAAQSVPTVASNVTGCVDAVIHDETGLHFDAGDPRDLAKKLDALLSDPHKRHLLGKQARARVEREFGRQLVWARTEKAYRREVESRTRKV